MRGPLLLSNEWLRKTRQATYYYDQEYWETLAASGVNAVRVGILDPWLRAHGNPGSSYPNSYADWSLPNERAEMLYELDHLVNTAAKHDMMVIINYCNHADYHDPDHSRVANEKGEFPRLETMDNLIDFWDIVAPRYADRTHVIYEPLNSYFHLQSEGYTEEVLEDTYRLYKLIRRAAPETHITLMSFHVPDIDSSNRDPMVSATRKLEDLGVDFSNASVSFRLFHLDLEHDELEEAVLELMADYPVISTLLDFPEYYSAAPATDDALVLITELTEVQSMERLGISWFHKNIDTPKLFEQNFVNKILPDAREKNYFWGSP